MKSEHPESFREGSPRSADVIAPRDAVTVDRTPIATPATLWLETVESMFEGYGAIVRLAFGVGRTDGQSETPGMIAPWTSKPAEPPSNGEPDSVSSPLVKLRPKRTKTSARGKNRSRSKISSIMHRRRAA
jgi:hypothetical protein